FSRDWSSDVCSSDLTGDIVLVGHSMGGMTVMALAEAEPGLFRDRVLGVGLISTSAGGLHRITWGLGSMLGGAVNRYGPRALQQLSPHQEFFDSLRRGCKGPEVVFDGLGSVRPPVPLAGVRL